MNKETLIEMIIRQGELIEGIKADMEKANKNYNRFKTENKEKASWLKQGMKAHKICLEAETENLLNMIHELKNL